MIFPEIKKLIYRPTFAEKLVRLWAEYSEG